MVFCEMLGEVVIDATCGIRGVEPTVVEENNGGIAVHF